MYFYIIFKIDFQYTVKPIGLLSYLWVFGAHKYTSNLFFKINVLNLYQLRIAESSTVQLRKSNIL